MSGQTSPALPPVGHPLAIWLHRIADHLDAIFVRYRESPVAPWSSRALADLPEEIAAWHVADFLRRWPFIPTRLQQPAAEPQHELTSEELKRALHRERAIVQHFSEIRERVLVALAERRSGPASGDRQATAENQLLADASALVGYLQLILGENERMVAFLAGLEEAGTISREELELLMGLRRD